MSIDVDVTTNGARVSVGRKRVAEIAATVLRREHARHALLSITFVSRRAIARLNARHLGHAGPTDVISFGFTRATDADPVVGDIYICPDIARQNANANRASVREELTRLVVHGTLHVLGHDHPELDGREDSDMWLRQERHVRALSRPRT